MASLPLDCVDIFDDFEDPDSMEVTYCKQVSDEQFEEDTRSETDKALGELCLYLDQNPEFYARVLRKRKQEEMESAGVISYVKSKMMSLLHGEQYPHCLVSASECVQQTNALKAGMCKTFQLSQELKGNVTRHSARLVAKRQAKMVSNKNCDLPLALNEQEAQSDPSNASIPPGKSAYSGSAITANITVSKLNDPAQTGVHSTDLTTVDSSNSSVLGVPAIVLSRVNEGNNNSQGNYSCENGGVGELKGHQQKVSGPEGTKAQPALLQVSSTIVLTPPPAPPLPAHFVTSAITRNSIQHTQQTPAGAGKNQSPRSHRKTQSPKSHRKTHSPKLRTPKNVGLAFHKERRSSPRINSYRMRMDEVPSRSSSLQNLSTLSGTSSVSSPFLTPDIPTRYKTLRRTGSNSSLNSLSSYGSCSSINSEILLSNPISRLKATPVIRSPGGTPLRQMKDSVPSEPIHRALYTAIRSRFRNVSTPSPGSGNASINANNNSLLNNTFSP